MKRSALFATFLVALLATVGVWLYGPRHASAQLDAGVAAQPSVAPTSAPSASVSATAEPPPRPAPPPPPKPTASATEIPVVDEPPPPPPAEEPLPAPTAEPAPPPAPEAEPAAEVRIGETLAFEIRTRNGDRSAVDRARSATKALKDAFDVASPEDVHVEKTQEFAIVYLGAAPIVQLTEADARVAGDASLDVHADAIAAKLRKAIRAEKERTALASRIFSISLVVFFGIVVFYLLRKIGDIAERANGWVEDNPHRIPAIRVRSLTLLNPAAFRSAVILAIAVGKWVSQFAIGYVWLLAALGLFETTRGYTDKLNGVLLQPFVALTTRVASSLPITIVVVIAALVVTILFRVVGLFFESVRTGATAIEWMPPELAKPTSVLVRGGLLFTTLIFAAPVLTGHPDGALARAGAVWLVTMGLASVPLLASCTVGVLIVYGRRYRVGEHVRMGSSRGKVVDVGLLDVTLEDDDGNEIRIPHLLNLVRPAEMLGDAPRVLVTIEVERARATERLLRELTSAIGSVGAEPRAEIQSIRREAVEIALSVLSEEVDARSRIQLAALDILEQAARPPDSQRTRTVGPPI